MIILYCFHLIGEAAGYLHLYFIFRFILAVAAGAFALPELCSGEDRFFADDFLYVVADSVFVNVFIGFKTAGELLVTENKNDFTQIL